MRAHLLIIGFIALVGTVVQAAGKVDFNHVHLNGDGTRSKPLDFTYLADATVFRGDMNNKEDSLAAVLMGISETTDFCSQPENADAWVKYKGLRSGFTVHLFKALYAIKGVAKGALNVAAAPIAAPVVYVYAKMYEGIRKKFNPNYKSSFTMTGFVKGVIKEYAHLVKEEVSKGQLKTRTTQCKNIFKGFCGNDCSSCKKDVALANACVEYCAGNSSVQKRCKG